MYAYPYNMNNNMQQQLAQNRMEQLQQQYNNMFPMMQQQQQQPQQFLKGRPVSSLEEARASIIDLDGSLFVFTDIANNKIYTKQIMLDGTAELKTYELVEQNKAQVERKNNNECVSKQEFDEVIGKLKRLFVDLRDFPLMRDEFVGAVNNRPYSFN